MTQIGKCDTCRARKVKCDEKKPKCGACGKKNRICTYSYGKASALVREDPNQFSGHGKSKSTPHVVPLVTSYVDSGESSGSESPLRLITEEQMENQDGMFQTFIWTTREDNDDEKPRELVKVRKSTTPSTISLESQSPGPWHTIPFAPSNPLDELRARCMNMFGPYTWGLDSLSIHGSWIESIPARLGSSQVFDLAADFAVKSFATFKDKSESQQRKALVSRSKALKALRSAIKQDGSKKIPSYDLLLATKLHAYAEIFVSVGTFAFTYHALGLSEMLRCGDAVGIDPEHYWSLVEHTYIDEVNEAALSGRPSIFDTPLYRKLTHPKAPSESRPQTSFEHPETTISVMHVLIQIPRLACLVRQAIKSPNDTKIVFAAIELASSIWDLGPSESIASIVANSTITVHGAPAEEIADVIPSRLAFDSVHTIILCTRYWSFQMYVSALIQNLWHHFPLECASSSLVDLDTAQQIDISAATLVAQSLSFSLFYSPTLPLVPLRVLGPVSLSVGPWYRLYSRLASSLKLLQPGTPEAIQVNVEMEKSRRLEDWVVEECHRIHDAWDVARANRETFELLIDSMAGGEVVEWIVNRVSWNDARAVMRKQGIEV